MPDNFIKMSMTGEAVTHILKMLYQCNGKVALYEEADKIFNGALSPSMALKVVEGKAKLVGADEKMKYVEEVNDEDGNDILEGNRG